MKYTEEKISKAVQESRSIREVLRKIGASETSGTIHAHIKNRIKKLGLDTSHFLGQASNYGKNHSGGIRKLEYKEVLVFERKTCREHSDILRRAVLESGIKNKCKKCGISSWLGNKITLEIHHKDENPRNNIKENIELLCPNCHSQK